MLILIARVSQLLNFGQRSIQNLQFFVKEKKRFLYTKREFN